jgi:hypothetical protein
MPRVHLPFHSASASGRIGEEIHSSWRGRPYVKRYSKPYRPETLPQRAHTALMCAIPVFWHSLTREEQNTWCHRAREQNYSPFNAFAKAAHAFHRECNGIQRTPGDHNPNRLTAPTDFTAVAVAEGIHCTWADPADPNLFGLIILVAHRTIPTTAGSMTLAYALPGQREVTIPLPPGEYYLRAAAFNTAGTSGRLSEEISLTL